LHADRFLGAFFNSLCATIICVVVRVAVLLMLCFIFGGDGCSTLSATDKACKCEDMRL